MFDPMAFINKLLSMPPEEAAEFLKNNFGDVAQAVEIEKMNAQAELAKKGKLGDCGNPDCCNMRMCDECKKKVEEKERPPL